MGNQVEQSIAQRKFERNAYKQFEMSFHKPTCLDRAIVLTIGPTLFGAAQLLGVGDYDAQLSLNISQYPKHSTHQEKRIISAHGFRDTTACSDGPSAVGGGESVRHSRSSWPSKATHYIARWKKDGVGVHRPLQ